MIFVHLQYLIFMSLFRYLKHIITLAYYSCEEIVLPISWFEGTSQGNT